MKKNFILFYVCVLLSNESISQCLNNVYKGFGGSGYDMGGSILTDNVGNAYITGTFVDSIQLGSYTLTADTVGIYLMKLSEQGNVLWAKLLITEDHNNGYKVVLKISPSGKLLVAGTSKNFQSDFDSLVNPFTGGDVFLAQYNITTGSLEKFLSTGNHGYSSVADFDFDDSGNIYMAGGFVGPITFGSFNMVCTGTGNTWIAKFNSDFVAQWAMRATNNPTSGNGSSKIVYDGGAYVYVAGGFGISCNFGSGFVLNSPSYNNGYLAKIDTSGNISWVKSSRPDGTYFHLLLVDTSTIFVVRESPAELVRYNQFGDTTWSRVIGTNAYTLFNEVKFYGGRIFAGGNRYGTLTLSDSTYNIPEWFIYIARFDLNGSVEAIRSVGICSATLSFDIDDDQNIHIAGSYCFPDTIEQTMLPAFGNNDILYSKLCHAAVGVNEQIVSEKTTPFPIPFSENLHLDKTEDGGDIILFDIEGREVLKQASVSGQTSISTISLAPGFYVLHYSNKSLNKTWKVVKN